MLSELHTILNFSVKKWSKGPKKFKMVKMTKKVQNYQIDQNGQNDQKWSIWSKNWEKVREKNKSIEARDDARA